jgi:hypothetical protein
MRARKAVNHRIQAPFSLVLLTLACGTVKRPAEPGKIAPAAAPSPAASETPPPVVTITPHTSVAEAPKASAKPFECSVVLGLAVTQEWFSAGFEPSVGDARWQAILRPHTFVEQWANPQDPVWSQAPLSSCEQRTADPDRVVFFAADWNYKDEGEWITGLTAAVNAIRFKFRGARVIELLPMVRGPNNASCGDAKSVVEPFVDQAIERVAAQFSGLVRPGPKFEVARCDWFEKGGPHFTTEGRGEVAKLIAAHYATAQ